MPLILAPRSIDLYEFQASQGYILRACLKTNKQRRHVSLDFLYVPYRGIQWIFDAYAKELFAYKENADI